MQAGPIPFPDRARCLEFVLECYEGHETRCNKPLYEQAVAIANHADGLLTDYYMDTIGMVLPPYKYLIDSAYCGGLLHVFLQVEPYACFETIVDLTNLDTARLVSTITRDCRLPGPQRHRDLLGRLYDAPLEVQVVKFAEVSTQVSEVQEEFKRLRRADAKQRHRTWLVEKQETIAALQKVRAAETMHSNWSQIHEGLGQLLRNCDSSSSREKIRANIAKNNAAAQCSRNSA
jgi:hypothetical protein